MSRRKLVRLSEVWGMLAQCAVGYTSRLTNHYYQVTFNKKIYPALPKGEHGKSDPEIEFGHVMKMARSLGFLECAETYFGVQKPKS